MPDDNSFSLPTQDPSKLPVEAQKPQSQPAPGSAAQPVQTEKTQEGFMAVLSATLSVVKKKVFVFLGLTILNFAVVGILAVVGIPLLLLAALSAGLIFMPFAILFFVLLAMMVSYFFYGTVSHQAGAIIQNLPMPVGKSFAVTLKSTGKMVNLAWKTFVYTGFWIPLLLPVILAVLNSLFFSTGVSSGTGNLILTILNFGLTGLALAFGVIATIRFLRTTLSFPILIRNNEMKAKEALEASVKITKGKWWMMFSFVVVFSFLLGFIPAGLKIAAGMAQIDALNSAATVLGVIFGILSYSMNSAFLQVLADKLNNPNITMKLNIGMLIGALVIFLAPIILAVALPLLALMSLQSRMSSLTSTSGNPITSGNITTTDSTVTSQELSGEALITANTDDSKIKDNLQALVTAIENYHTQTGVYPDESHCVSDFFTKKWPYLSNFQAPNDIQYQQFTGFMSGINFYCSNPMFQYFDDGKFALFAVMNNPANGNLDRLLTSLDDANQFQASSSGKYSVILHLQGNTAAQTQALTQVATQEPAATVEPTLTQQTTVPVPVARPKVKRVTGSTKTAI